MDEGDSLITSVTYRNFAPTEKRIQKSFEQLNRLNTKLDISLRPEYLQLKLKELRLVHEYTLKRQEEKEEQVRIRELMREAEKLESQPHDAVALLAPSTPVYRRAAEQFLAALTAMAPKAVDGSGRSVLL